MHPAWRRCSSVAYSRYSPSSRLASRAPRRPRCDNELRRLDTSDRMDGRGGVADDEQREPRRGATGGTNLRDVRRPACGNDESPHRGGRHPSGRRPSSGVARLFGGLRRCPRFRRGARADRGGARAPSLRSRWGAPSSIFNGGPARSPPCTPIASASSLPEQG